MKKIFVLLLAVVLAGLLSACGGAQETVLSGQEKEAVLAFSEAKTDTLMAALKAGDYAAFTQDFDESMSKAMPQSGFETLKKDRDEKLGAYVSRQVSSVNQSKSGKHVAVVYDAVFEKEQAVTMRVVFEAEEPHGVSGIWFSK